MWTKEEEKKFREQRQPTLNKFIQKMKSDGFEMHEDDEKNRYGKTLQNMVIKKGDKQIKVALHCMYRYSGMSRVMKPKKGSNLQDINVD